MNKINQVAQLEEELRQLQEQVRIMELQRQIEALKRQLPQYPTPWHGIYPPGHSWPTWTTTTTEPIRKAG